MLGAKKSQLEKILYIELFFDFNIAYIMSIIFILLTRIDIFHVQYVASLSKYINLVEVVLMYIVIFLITKIISKNTANKIFKDTIINTYNREEQ